MQYRQSFQFYSIFLYTKGGRRERNGRRSEARREVRE